MKKFFIENFSSAMVLISFLGCLSCASNKNETQTKLFDFDSLLQSQVQQLIVTNAVLRKEVQMQDTVEQITLERLDSQRWMNELEIFQQLSQINKPINRTSYYVTESNDTQSNLLVRTFHSDDDIPFQDVKIYYLQNFINLRKIEGTIVQQNPIYKSTRELTLNFNEVHNKHHLVSYSIKGGQQIIMGDTLQINVQGFITIQE